MSRLDKQSSRGASSAAAVAAAALSRRIPGSSSRHSSLGEPMVAPPPQRPLSPGSTSPSLPPVALTANATNAASPTSFSLAAGPSPAHEKLAAHPPMSTSPPLPIRPVASQPAASSPAASSPVAAASFRTSADEPKSGSSVTFDAYPRVFSIPKHHESDAAAMASSPPPPSHPPRKTQVESPRHKKTLSPPPPLPVQPPPAPPALPASTSPPPSSTTSSPSSSSSSSASSQSSSSSSSASSQSSSSSSASSQSSSSSSASSHSSSSSQTSAASQALASLKLLPFHENRQMTRSKALVLYFDHDNEMILEPLRVFIESYLNLQQQTMNKRNPALYYGECSVVKHGEGSYKNTDGLTMSGLWINNVFKGSRTRQHDESRPMSSLGIPLPADNGESFSPPFSPPLSPRGDDDGQGPGSVDIILPGGPGMVLRNRVPSIDNSSQSNEHLSLFDRMFVDELRIFIFSYLDIRSLCRAAQVSTVWRRLTNDAALWANIYIRNFGYPQGVSLQKIDWKEAATARYLLERNWLCGACHRNTMRGHSGWVTCVDFVANKLVSSSYDGTVRLWNTQTGNMLQTLTSGRNLSEMSPLWCVQFSENLTRVLAGATDSQIREWDLNTGTIVRRYIGHQGGVKCLQIGRNQLVSGSDDKTIKIFDPRSGAQVNSIPVIGPVSGLRWRGDSLVVSSKRENEVFLYDLRTLHCVQVFRGHSKPVYSLDFDEAARPRLYTGSRDKMIYCWDMLSGECVRAMAGHLYTVMSVQVHDGKVVSGSADSTIKIWDANADTSRCIQTLRGHSEVVMSAKFDADKIVSGGADTTVLVWDFLRGSGNS